MKKIIIVFALMLTSLAFANTQTVSVRFRCGGERDLVGSSLVTNLSRIGSALVEITGEEVCFTRVAIATKRLGGCSTPMRSQQQCQSMADQNDHERITFHHRVCGTSFNEILEELLPGEQCKFQQVDLQQQSQQQ